MATSGTQILPNQQVCFAATTPLLSFTLLTHSIYALILKSQKAIQKGWKHFQKYCTENLTIPPYHKQLVTM